MKWTLLRFLADGRFGIAVSETLHVAWSFPSTGDHWSGYLRVRGIGTGHLIDEIDSCTDAEGMNYLDNLGLGAAIRQKVGNPRPWKKRALAAESVLHAIDGSHVMLGAGSPEMLSYLRGRLRDVLNGLPQDEPGDD